MSELPFPAVVSKHHEGVGGGPVNAKQKLKPRCINPKTLIGLK